MTGSLTLLLLTAFLGIGIQTTAGVQKGFDASNLYPVALGAEAGAAMRTSGDYA